jgi:hypothetical protein
MDYLSQNWMPLLVGVGVLGLYVVSQVRGPGEPHLLYGPPHLRELGEMLARVRTQATTGGAPSEATSLGARVAWSMSRQEDGRWQHHLSYNLFALGSLGLARASGTMFAALLLWEVGGLQDGWDVTLFRTRTGVWHLVLTHDEAHHAALLRRPPAGLRLKDGDNTGPLLAQLDPVRDELLQSMTDGVELEALAS